MDLINKKNIPLFKPRQNGSQIASLFDNRTCRHANLRLHLFGNDMRQTCFSKAWRAIKQTVVQGFTTALRCTQKDLELLLDLRLANVIF